MKAVLLRHPRTGGEWACPVAAVDGWLAKGWERADAAPALAEPVTAEALPAPKNAKEK